MSIDLHERIVWCRLHCTKTFRNYFNRIQCKGKYEGTHLKQQGPDSERSRGQVQKSESGQPVREQILQRFEAWLEHVLDEEEPLEGIADEFLSELEDKRDLDSIDAPDKRRDLYSTWSAMTALTQEVKLQGRAFTHLNDKLKPLLGLGDSIETVVEAHAEALSDARRIAEEAHASRSKRDDELLREVERKTRREILNVLLDTRNRLVRGLRGVRENLGKLDKYQTSERRLNRFFFKPDNRISHVLDIVSALREGYTLSLDRLDEGMQQLGVREISCEGQPFDPRTMNVVDVEENADMPDGMVLEVYRTGYMLDREVFHPAQVKVARAPMEAITLNRQSTS
ncbi:MAG: nucleotide exchange factor GrpE [Desulfobacterales bacterium C00003060]|nr:MAG: nucleotide exchange factor GrpE [Desulfobacterales bacterium S3730MH5]OEU79883.1 MAG: nucleotide exchange factor GrpE [Desulfobacterales bacterium C00003060]